MLKEGLIRLTGEKDIFYDSIEKVYRLRIYCPQCGKHAGCECYQHLEDAELDQGEVSYCCSYKCTVLVNMPNETENMHEAKQALDIKEPLSNVSEEHAKQIVEFLYENNIWDDDGIEKQGETCNA